MAGDKEVGRISIRVTPNLKGFYRDLKRELDATEKTAKAQIDVEPDLTGFRQKIAAATKNLPDAKVNVDVDRSALDRMQSVISKTVDRAANGMNSLPMPSFGSGVNPAGMAAMVGAVVAATPLITGLLGAAMAALTTLPGLIAAVAVPIGALALGMDGLKAAAARLKGPFEDLKKSISGAVETQFGPVFDQLGRVFPMLAASLPKVTQGMADVAKAFVDTITSATGMQRIEESISNIGAAISRSAPGIASFTDGLLTLASKFSEKLPGIADWFNGVGKSFSDWVTKFTTVGPEGTSAFDRAMQGLGETLKTIGGTLVEVGGKFLDAFSDPEKMKSFRTELEAVASALSGIATAMVTITGFFSTLGQVGGKQGWLDLMPIQIQFIADKIGQLPALLSSVWNGIASAASTAWSAVTSTVQSAVSSIGGIVSSIGGTLSGIWNNISAAASTAWNAVVSAVQSAWQAIVSAVSSGVEQAVSFVATLPGRITEIFSGLVGTMTSIGTSIMQGLANGISAGVNLVKAAVQKLANLIPEWAKSILGIHSPSTVFAEIGQFTAQGFADGLKDGQSRAIAAAAAMVDGVNKEFAQFGNPGAGDYFSKTVDMATDFGRSTIDQAMGDLGIGGGALSGALKWGMDFGASALSKLAGSAGDTYNFNVSSVDEAMAVQRNQQNKKALQYHRA